MLTSKRESPQLSDDEQTIRIARRRFARRQWARRWLVWRRLVALAALLGVVGGAVWLVFFSSVLAVTAVAVEGNDVLDTREVRRAAAVATGQPLARVNLEAIAARVEGLAPVQSVEVSRSWPDQVLIDITEREAVAVVEREDTIRGLDDEGVLFRDYPTKPAGLPVVRMSASTSADALSEVARVVEVLPDDLAAKVDYVEVQTVDTISMRLRNGRTIFWGSADQSDSKAQVIDVLLKQKASTYDVSVPGQPTITR